MAWRVISTTITGVAVTSNDPFDPADIARALGRVLSDPVSTGPDHRQRRLVVADPTAGLDWKVGRHQFDIRNCGSGRVSVGKAGRCLDHRSIRIDRSLTGVVFLVVGQQGSLDDHFDRDRYRGDDLAQFVGDRPVAGFEPTDVQHDIEFVSPGLPGLDGGLTFARGGILAVWEADNGRYGERRRCLIGRSRHITRRNADVHAVV